MSLLTLVGVEVGKIRRSKILLEIVFRRNPLRLHTEIQFCIQDRRNPKNNGCCCQNQKDFRAADFSQDYSFVLPPLFVLREISLIFLSAIPMIAFFQPARNEGRKFLNIRWL